MDRFVRLSNNVLYAGGLRYIHVPYPRESVDLNIDITFPKHRVRLPIRLAGMGLSLGKEVLKYVNLAGRHSDAAASTRENMGTRLENLILCLGSSNAGKELTKVLAREAAIRK